MSRVLNLLVTHQSPAAIGRMLAWWRDYCPPDQILIAFNGEKSVFDQIAHPHKIRVEDDRLRTRRHSRERQSYTAIYRDTSRWLAGRDDTHVHFVEYDHLPLVPDLNARQLARMEQERADVLGFELTRVDGTSQPHYLYHAALPGFADFWRTVSVRSDPTAVLSMFGSGSFWTRAAFDAVAAQAEPIPRLLGALVAHDSAPSRLSAAGLAGAGPFHQQPGQFHRPLRGGPACRRLDDPPGQEFMEWVRSRPSKPSVILSEVRHERSRRTSQFQCTLADHGG